MGVYLKAATEHAEGENEMGELLKDKSIIVVGGTKGVGRGVAEGCALEGAKLVIAGRDEDAANDIYNEVKAKSLHKPQFIKTDVTKTADLERLVEQTEKMNGKIDGLFYYSGLLPSAYLYETPEEVFDQVMNVNVKGSFYCAANVVKSMLKTGGGSIVFTGSAHGYGGEEDRAVYAVSKGALLTLMKHIAKNYTKHNIRANWITMGWVATPGEMALRTSQGRDMDWLLAQAAKDTPIGRLLTVEDHVPGILYLLSDKA
jgi:NAD(P)-dependent dehydrogenase (short-subunit alcohol dehydrogenase family)